MAKRIQKPSKTIRDRLTRCRREMKRYKISAMLITNPPDYRYLTGFTGEDSAILLQSKAVHVISDGRFDEALNQECPWVTRWMRKGSLNAEIGNVCKKLKLKSLAVQPQYLSLGDHGDLNKLCKPARLFAAPSILGPMRMIKDNAELAIIGKAVRVAEQAFKAMRATIRVGQTELEMAARLEYEMKRRGASDASFSTICAEGPNAALPHAHSGQRKVKKGSAILFDWGARVEGYCSDLTRMVFVGSIAPKMQKIYGIVLEAQKQAIKAVRVDNRMCDVDTIARGVIQNAGFGEQFNHGLGHGLGLDIHEAPSLSWRSDEKLKARTVVTVEPGIYLPGLGGVRIEDDVLVTSKGPRVLTHLSKSLDAAVL